MAYLNTQERDALLNQLKTMSFGGAQGKVRGLDQKARMVYYRNNQHTNQWETRYDLPSLGTRVRLIEIHSDRSKEGKLKSQYEFTEVMVEPLPDNRT